MTDFDSDLTLGLIGGIFTESDISQDGIYSAIYVPKKDGVYSINIVVEDNGSSWDDLFLSFNQSTVLAKS